MRRLVIPMLAAALFCGCATTKTGENGGFLARYSESKKLARATEMLAKDDPAGAAKVLAVICRDNPVPGVTDEALFRLALLHLKPGTERPASPQGRLLLKRLKTEYPASPWTVQAAPLLELVNVADELRRQNRNLRGVNQSLSREIGELNQNLERLKRLDQELEQKAR